MDVLVSDDALIITVDDGSTVRNGIDSSSRVFGLNLLGLTRVSQYLRTLTYQQSSPERIEQALCALRDAPPGLGVVCRALAAGCAGAAFCVLNGGDVSWVYSFIVGTAILGIRGP